MKLLIAIIQPENSKKLKQKLLSKRIYLTQIPGQGGFLNKKTDILLIGVENADLDKVLPMFKECCPSKTETISPESFPWLGTGPGDLNVPAKTTSLKIGGATVFVMDVE